MINVKPRIALVVLRTTLSCVVLAEAMVFLYSTPPGAAHFIPVPIRLLLGWGEVAGALLFLIPRTVPVRWIAVDSQILFSRP